MATKNTIDVVINGKNNTDRAFSALSRNLDNAESASKRLLTGIAAAGIAVAGMGLFGLKAAADLETAQIGLETLLGSAEAADATMKRIKEEAKRTPFELPGLSKGVQLLASVTKDGDKAIDIILDVGEGLAAMGKGQSELDRIMVNLQQIAALGRASSLDIKQFAFAGIPIYEMLAEKTGLAGEALGDFITSGGVTFDLLTEMFDEANDEGGRFFNAYIDQTGSLNQVWSNFKDTLLITADEIVRNTGLFDWAKTVVAGLGDNIVNLVEKIKGLIIWFRENETAIYIVAGAIMGALVPALWSMVAAFAAGAIALAPWAIGGVLIGALVGGVKYLIDNWDEFKKNVGIVWDAIMDVWDKAVGYISDKTDKLIGVFTKLIDKIKSAIDWIKKYSGYNLAKGAVNKVGGALGFDKGGIVPGPIGAPQMAVVHGGETILPTHKSNFGGGGGVVNINISGNTLLSDDAGRMIGRQIIGELGLNLRGV